MMASLMKKVNPVWALRAGLGAMYLYSGYDIVKHPTAWYWALRALPQSTQGIINNHLGIDNYLIAQGTGELLFALILFAWFVPKRFVKWVAALTAAEMFLILVLVGVDSITFRDVGLLGAAVALFLLLKDDKPAYSSVNSLQNGTR